MATTTAHFALAKPGYEDPVDIAVVNANMDAIDTELARAAGEEIAVTLATNRQVLSLFDDGRGE